MPRRAISIASTMGSGFGVQKSLCSWMGSYDQFCFDQGQPISDQEKIGSVIFDDGPSSQVMDSPADDSSLDLDKRTR